MNRCSCLKLFRNWHVDVSNWPYRLTQVLFDHFVSVLYVCFVLCFCFFFLSELFVYRARIVNKAINHCESYLGLSIYSLSRSIFSFSSFLLAHFLLQLLYSLFFAVSIYRALFVHRPVFFFACLTGLAVSHWSYPFFTPYLLFPLALSYSLRSSLNRFLPSFLSLFFLPFPF